MCNISNLYSTGNTVCGVGAGASSEFTGSNQKGPAPAPQHCKGSNKN